MRVIERAAEHYEIQDMEFGRGYRWCPEHVVIEYDCGKRLTLAPSMTTCECGAHDTVGIGEELISGGG